MKDKAIIQPSIRCLECKYFDVIFEPEFLKDGRHFLCEAVDDGTFYEAAGVCIDGFQFKEGSCPAFKLLKTE